MPSNVMRRLGCVPSVGTTKMCFSVRFSDNNTLCTTNATVNPSGESCGSEIRASCCNAETSKGFLATGAGVCAASAAAMNNRDRTRMIILTLA